LPPEVSDWSEAILQLLTQGERVSPRVATGDPVDELMSIYGRLGVTLRPRATEPVSA
jgi:hypothetical protein